MSVTAIPNNIMDRGDAYPRKHGNLGNRQPEAVGFSDHRHLRRGKLGLAGFNTALVGSVRDLMRFVLLLRDPRQVGKRGVNSIPIKMRADHAFRPSAAKRLQNNLMNRANRADAALPQANARVITPYERGENVALLGITNSPLARDVIQPLEASDLRPLFHSPLLAQTRSLVKHESAAIAQGDTP